MKASTVMRGCALARTGIGVALALGTRPILRAMVGDEEPDPSYVLFARTVGIRDTLFGLGGLLATMKGRDPAEGRRWVKWWLANELADVVAATAMSGQLGVSGAATAALTPLPIIAADIWVLRQHAHRPN